MPKVTLWQDDPLTLQMSLAGNPDTVDPQVDLTEEEYQTCLKAFEDFRKVQDFLRQKDKEWWEAEDERLRKNL